MNRRQFLTRAGAGALALTGGYAGLRVTDIRPYDPALPEGETPSERITAAAAHRFAADHRIRTTTRVLDDWLGAAPYEFERYTQWHQPSRRRHLHALTTFDSPLTRSQRMAENPHQEYISPTQTIHALLHYNRVYNDDALPLTMVLHLSDGHMLWDHDAPTPEAGDSGLSAEAIRVSGDDVGLTDTAAGQVFTERLRPHRTTWKEVRREDGTVTYRVAGGDAYAQVVPLSMAPIASFRDPWVEVTLDTETGRLQRVVDHRDALYDIFANSDPVPLTYRIESEIDQYGTATAPRPGGSASPALDARLRSYLLDLFTY